jgi:signal transduction histidine kinase
LFPDVPVLFISAAEPHDADGGRPRGVTGVLRQPSQVETVEVALNLHPATRRLLVIAFSPRVDGFQQRVRSTMSVFASRVNVTYANEPTLPELLAALRRLPKDSLVFWVRYSPATSGRVIFPDELLPEIAAATPVPIYASLEPSLGKGVVGGMMRNNIPDAHKLAGMALRILEGTPPDSMPLEHADASPTFDWRALQRWGIDESALPPGSDIRYRVPTAWQLYGAYVAGTVVIVIAQLVLITGLLRERRRVRRADEVIRASEASLRGSYQRIRHMAGQLINAQEAARAQIARDLHDDVCQRLACVCLGVSNLRRATRNIEGLDTRQAFVDIDRDTQSALEGVRRLSHDLHPETLRLLGLAPARRAHCNEVAGRHGVEVQFFGGDIGTVPPDLSVCFFRIAQESLRNGIMHGHARHLTVRLARQHNRLELDVLDDGCGFDIYAEKGNRKGLGLIMMEERATLVGGTAEIDSQIGDGTTVRVVAPITESN